MRGHGQPLSLMPLSAAPIRRAACGKLAMSISVGYMLILMLKLRSVERIPAQVRSGQEGNPLPVKMTGPSQARAVPAARGPPGARGSGSSTSNTEPRPGVLLARAEPW